MFRSFIAVIILAFLIYPCRAQPPVEVVGNPERGCAVDAEPDNGLACVALPKPLELPALPKIKVGPNGFYEFEVVAGRDEEWGEGFYIFSHVHEHSGAPYLAFAPIAGLQIPQSWKFFAGRGLSGSVSWVEYERWQNHTAGDGTWDPGDHARLFSESRTCGGIQVEWNAQLARFLMLYGCDDEEAYVRVAQHASGPWSEATHFSEGAKAREPHLLAGYDAVGPAQPGSRTAVVTWESIGYGANHREIRRTTVRQQGAE